MSTDQLGNSKIIIMKNLSELPAPKRRLASCFNEGHRAFALPRSVPSPTGMALFAARERKGLLRTTSAKRSSLVFVGDSENQSASHI